MESEDIKVAAHMDRLAKLYRGFYDSLREQGFSSQESFELVKAEISRPSSNTGRGKR